ncbi:MAG: D-alanyl-D-alanine carboxypeptidase [Dehalococcoidia bacterium]|nr:D-alanyl-D-alanine carboxypeptidase [Dehalococcoidia bacterium]
MRGHILGLGCFVVAVLVAVVPLDGRHAQPSAAASDPPPATLTTGTDAAAAVAEPTNRQPTSALPSIVPLPSAPAPRSRGITPPAPTSASVLLLDDASGGVLFERNGHQPLAPASLTKIATAIVAIEQSDLEAVADIDVDSRTMRGSTVMGLEPGDRFSLRDLLYGLMLPSGNDAALAIGRQVAGSDAAFVARMNDLVARLGLRDSHFVNPHGLGGAGHVTSAYDLAMLSRYAMRLPAYREIASADMWVARGSRELTLFSLVSTDRWTIPGVDAGKSGYTRAAGRTLVLTAERDGHRLHVVVMNDPQTEQVAAALLEWGYANFEWPTPAAVAAAIASEPAP